jgi:hypothetical protein
MGSSPDEVDFFFNLPNPSSRIMALGFTQPLTEIFLGVKGWLARKADLTPICELSVWIMWDPQCLTTLWASMACYRDSFTFFIIFT